MGGLDLLVNNASVLGPSPQPGLADYPIDVLALVESGLVLADRRDGALAEGEVLPTIPIELAA